MVTHTSVKSVGVKQIKVGGNYKVMSGYELKELAFPIYISIHLYFLN